MFPDAPCIFLLLVAVFAVADDIALFLDSVLVIVDERSPHQVHLKMGRRLYGTEYDIARHDVAAGAGAGGA